MGLPNVSPRPALDPLPNGSNWFDKGTGEDLSELDFFLNASEPTVRTSDCSESEGGERLSSRSRRFMVRAVEVGPPQGSKSPKTDLWGPTGLKVAVVWGGLRRGEVRVVSSSPPTEPKRISFGELGSAVGGCVVGWLSATAPVMLPPLLVT